MNNFSFSVAMSVYYKDNAVFLIEHCKALQNDKQ